MDTIYSWHWQQGTSSHIHKHVLVRKVSPNIIFMLQSAVVYFGKRYNESIKSTKEVMSSSYKTPNKNVQLSESHAGNTPPGLLISLSRTFSLWNWWSSCLISGLMSCCVCFFFLTVFFSMPFKEWLTRFQLFHLGPSFLEGGGERKEGTDSCLTL